MSDFEPNITYVVRMPQDARKVTLVEEDLGSRYKTRQLQVQQVGTTKMIRTYLCNVNEVAYDCKVPPDYLGYFLGYELSCVTKVDKKRPPREQIYLSGAHEDKKMSGLVRRFVREVVACPVCKLPELSMAVDKKKVISNCRGCGSKKAMKFSNEKFTRYVLNHPPKSDGWAGNKAGDKTDKGKKVGKKNRQRDEDDEDDESPAAEESVSETSRAETESPAPQEEGLVNEELAAIADAEAARLAAGQSVDVSIAPTINDWATDTSADAVAKRQEAFAPKSEADHSKLLGAIAQAASSASSDTGAAISALREVQSERSLDAARFVEVMVEALFPTNPPCDFLKAFDENRRQLFAAFAPEGATSEQASILDGVETWMATVSDKQELPPATIIADVKFLYDADICEEEAIMLWWTRPSASKSLAVRQALTPFVEWLQEAEEETSDEED